MRGKPESAYSPHLGHGITPADAGKTPTPERNLEFLEDHPRGCGENENADLSGLVGTGSPPRMRGKRLLCFIGIARRRITPADAGKTIWFRLRSACRWDHPRGCGENLRADAVRVARAGSPPRMRGKHTDAMALNIHDRITPADAGKTTRHRRSHRRSRDHPRGCGENC